MGKWELYGSKNWYEQGLWPCGVGLLGWSYETAGFASKWIDLIMKCITFVRYAIIVNEQPEAISVQLKGYNKGILYPPIFSFFVMSPWAHNSNSLNESDS